VIRHIAGGRATEQTTASTSLLGWFLVIFVALFMKNYALGYRNLKKYMISIRIDRLTSVFKQCKREIPSYIIYQSIAEGGRSVTLSLPVRQYRNHINNSCAPGPCNRGRGAEDKLRRRKCHGKGLIGK